MSNNKNMMGLQEMHSMDESISFVYYIALFAFMFLLETDLSI